MLIARSYSIGGRWVLLFECLWLPAMALLPPRLVRKGSAVKARVLSAFLALVSLPQALLTLWKWRDVAPVRSDYTLYLASSLQGLGAGWHYLYDLDAQRRTFGHFFPGLAWFPNVYTPVLSVVMVSFTLLPLGTGYVIWSLILFACLVLSWWLLAPGDWLTRLALFLMLLAAEPVRSGLWLGQIIPLQMAALALACVAMERGRDRTAGALLAVMALKPQGMILVPFALLAAGKKRIFFSWGVATAILGAGVLALISLEGAAAYLHRLDYAQSHPAAFLVAWSYSLARRLGTGAALRAVQVAAVACTLFAAWRHRDKPEIAIAAGLIGSLVAAPYVHLQDFMLLFPAGWLLLRAAPRPLTVFVLLLGYAALLSSAAEQIGGRWVLLFICALLPAIAASPRLAPSR